MIVVDTGFLFAFLSPHDVHHDDAVGSMKRIARGEWGQPIVSDLVIAELLNLTRARKMPADIERRAAALLTGDKPSLENLASVPAPSAAGMAAILEVFQRHHQLSFTDAALLDEVRRRPSCRLATFDSGFNGLCEVVP